MKVYHGKNNNRGIRDYNRRRLGNPLFKNKTRQKRRTRDFGHIRRIILLVILGVALVGGLWYLFWSQAFRITEIEIEGAGADTEQIIRDILEERLQERRFLLLPQSAIFIYDANQASQDVLDQIFLDQLEIRKRLPHTLTVNLQERTAVAAFIDGGDILALDESGHVIRSLTRRERISLTDLPESVGQVDSGELGAESVDVAEIEGVTEETGEPDLEELRRNSNPMPLVLDRQTAAGGYEPGDQPVSPEVLLLILQVHDRLADVTGSGVRWYSLESAKDTVDVLNRAGWHVYLTTMIPFDKQAERLTLVLKEKIGERKNELEYVDLRYDERIFFRFIDEEE